jgi:dihydropteroate synthase
MYVGPPRHVMGLPAPSRALVMGVLNVTPDSFSDGGRWFDTDKAVEHGRRLARQGADLVDVGGESTRPGAVRPSPQEELDRVLPVIGALAADGVSVSVDTMRAEVAAEALDAGAILVNDVSGGRADPDMFATVAGRQAPYVLMHWRAHSAQMQKRTEYDDVVAEVADELTEQLDRALDAGIDKGRIAIDPGIGFSKTADQNWEVLAATERYHDLGYPLLVATSRKRFLGHLLAGLDGDLRAPLERDDATTATTALAAVAGAWCIRAHAVRATADAVRAATRWAQAAQARTQTQTQTQPHTQPQTQALAGTPRPDQLGTPDTEGDQ